MHFVDVYWLVLPVCDRAGVRPHWLDLAALLFVGGLSCAWIVRATRRARRCPLHDPELADGLELRGGGMSAGHATSHVHQEDDTIADRGRSSRRRSSASSSARSASSSPGVARWPRAAGAMRPSSRPHGGRVRARAALGVEQTPILGDARRARTLRAPSSARALDATAGSTATRASPRIPIERAMDLVVGGVADERLLRAPPEPAARRRRPTRAASTRCTSSSSRRRCSARPSSSCWRCIFLVRYRGATPGEPTPRAIDARRSHGARASSARILTLFLVFWVVGASQYDRMMTPPAGRDARLRDREAVDVEVRVPGRALVDGRPHGARRAARSSSS